MPVRKLQILIHKLQIEGISAWKFFFGKRKKLPRAVHCLFILNQVCVTQTTCLELCGFEVFGPVIRVIGFPCRRKFFAAGF